MMIIPTIGRADRTRLHHINPHLEARWNRRFARWEIWFDAHCGKMPYIIEVSDLPNPFDDRLFTSLRHAFWFSQNIVKNVERMNREFRKKQEKKLADEEDMHYQLGKEVAPLLRSMKDAGNSSHGNSKFLFPGVDLGGET
jgi:hypothetical protein